MKNKEKDPEEKKSASICLRCNDRHLTADRVRTYRRGHQLNCCPKCGYSMKIEANQLKAGRKNLTENDRKEMIQMLFVAITNLYNDTHGSNNQ